MSDDKPEAFAFLEGIRGLAALQVVLLHYASAFLPILARTARAQHYTWEAALATSPLAYVLDGYSAVYLFFLMSGFVLGQSFLRTGLPLWRVVIKRFLRLFLPVAAAASLAALLYPVISHTRDAAFAIGQSGWLAGPYRNPMAVWTVAKDVLLNSMLLGYEGVSLLPGLFGAAPSHWLSPQAFSLNPPMWTLHGEFWGSLFVLGLAKAYRTAPPRLFGAGVVILLLWLGCNQISLFVIGFFLYLVRGSLLEGRGWVRIALSVLTIGTGIWICMHRQIPPVTKLDVWLLNHTRLHALNDDHFHSSLGALLVFLGVLVNTPLRRTLSVRPLRELGRLSFSIYLLHFPILLSVGCAVLTAIAPYGYGLAVLVSLATGGGVTLAAAILFERWVDKPSIVVSNRAAWFSRGKSVAGSGNISPSHRTTKQLIPG